MIFASIKLYFILYSSFLFFNIGGAELIFIVLIIILLFGAKKIPEMARAFGKGIYEVKNLTSQIQQEIHNSTQFEEKNNISNDEEKKTKKDSAFSDTSLDPPKDSISRS